MNARAPHVLVVDDEPLAAKGMAAYLGRKGYRTSTAGDGGEALRLHESDPADLVVTDLRMPRGGGRSLIAELRRTDPRLPVIIVTGSIDFEPRTEPRAEGEGVLLRKPVDLRELAALIEKALGAPPPARK